MYISFLIGVFVFIFGLCIGSFLNCVIYRLEHKKSLGGRSFCPKCKHVLSWKDLFPLFSWLFLGAKCRYCKKKISWQYPVLELATGLLFLLVYFTGNGNFLSLLFLLYVACALIVIFVYDFKHYIIPDSVLFPLIGVSIIYGVFMNPEMMAEYILAAIIASGFFYAIFFVSNGRWMGFGDVKLAVFMGLLLGLKNVILALFLAFFFGAIIGLILMFLKKKGLKSEIPFGPFLILGTFVALLWGQYIIQWYANLFVI